MDLVAWGDKSGCLVGCVSLLSVVRNGLRLVEISAGGRVDRWVWFDGLVWWDGWSHWGKKCGRLIGWLFRFIVSCVG